MLLVVRPFEAQVHMLVTWLECVRGALFRWLVAGGLLLEYTYVFHCKHTRLILHCRVRSSCCLLSKPTSFSGLIPHPRHLPNRRNFHSQLKSADHWISRRASWCVCRRCAQAQVLEVLVLLSRRLLEASDKGALSFAYKFLNDGHCKRWPCALLVSQTSKQPQAVCKDLYSWRQLERQRLTGVL